MMTLADLWVLAQRQGPYGQWDGHMWGWGWVPMWLVGTLLMVGLLVLAGLVVWALARSSRPSGTSAPSSRPRAILDERYARGELTTEEYRERLQVLDEGPGRQT